MHPRLDEIADVRLGRQRSPKNHSGLRMRPYLRAANVTWSGLDLTDVKEMNFTPAESETYELQPGDVLVAEASGSASEVGKPVIWRGEIPGCCFQNTLVRVRTQHCSPEYVRYFLLSEARSGRIGNASPGVGIHHIGAARLSAWRVPLAPFNEQRRIVTHIEEHLSRLDAAEALLAATTRRIALLREQAVAQATQGDWPTVPLGEIAEIVGGVTKDAKRQNDPGFVESRTCVSPTSSAASST
jgi:type I restriction enzyme S subunit